MTGPGSKRYKLRSQGSSQAFPRTVNTTEKSSSPKSFQPLFEAFQIGAWWDMEIVERRGEGYLVHFEGYGRHEEQVLPPSSIRLRSRKAENPDCHCLIRGADVVAFAVHPYASRSGSDMSFYSAWYDVKIVSKEYKHHLCACACKFQVKFYGDTSQSVDVEKRRGLLEGTEIDVMIGKIGILQEVAFDSPLESIIAETLTNSKKRIKKQWSKDIYTLNLNCVFQKPVVSGSKKEDSRTSLTKVKSELPTSCSDNGFSEGKSVEDLYVHGQGKKRARRNLPPNAEAANMGVYVECGRSVKHARTENDRDELRHITSDETSSSYQLSGTDESYDSEHTSVSCDSKRTSVREDHATDDSPSRSTPVFYGCIEKDPSKSTSTRTFYGNTGGELNEDSGSTEVFYGPTGKDEGNSTSTACCGVSGEEGSACHCENMQTSSDCSQSMLCRACESLGVDNSPPMTMPPSFQEESLNKAQAQKDNIKTSIDSGTAANLICSDSEHGTKNLVREGDMKRVKCKQKPNFGKTEPITKLSKDKQKPTFGNTEPIARKRNDEQKPTFGNIEPIATKRKEENAKMGVFQSKSAIPHNQGRVRSLRVKETKKDFNDLFEIILKSVHELQKVKGMMSPDDIDSLIEKNQNQVPWDPLVFYEREDFGPDAEIPPEDGPSDYLWRDMELAFEEMKMPKMGATALTQQHDVPWKDKISACEHYLVLNEEEGYVCVHCGFLIASIENICPPIQVDKVHRGDHDDKIENDVDAFEAAFDVSKEQEIMSRKPLKINVASVWELIPELRALMQKNQVDGFNFLWENIGSLCSQDDTQGGGCIIAHAPGTGKSLLIISFLKTFLLLNSWCRPLIVAPKNMLLSWQKEFGKWKANIKVHLLRASPPSSLNYLKIISEWQKSTSVLIVTYQLFSSLTDEDRARRKPQNHRLGSLLLHIPDILILDEGHVPRNCSKLRASVMQFRTRFKILVSGTLFQNNLNELFNLLSLARPNFLDYLGPQFYNKRVQGLDMEDASRQWQSFEDFEKEKWKWSSQDLAESTCRKMFMEEIGNKLEMNVEKNEGAEFKGAIQKLHAITSPFIHFYSGEILNKLPGIKESIVVLQATHLQAQLSTQIKQQDHFETSLSIHPYILLKWKGTKSWAFLNVNELKALRADASPGPKVKFILDLADCCCLLKEKLLIFSQYLPTLEYVAEMLQNKFEVVTIIGKDRLEERQKTMDKFNDSEGMLVLLASLTACGEGINLTGASRVVFLDMHWNPARMKQAIGRAFRLGQKKVVYTYWLMASVEKEAEKFTRIQKKDFLSRSIFSSGLKECQQQEQSIPDMKGEDVILEQLLKNDIGKSILKVVQYSALERGTLSAFFEQYNFSVR